MSVLTKIFVAVLSLLSLTMTAGVVSFIYRVDDLRTRSELQKQQIDLLKDKEGWARAEAAAVRIRAEALQASVNQLTSDLATKVEAEKGKTRDVERQLAASEKARDVQMAAAQAADQTAKMAMELQKTAREEVAKLTRDLDEIARKNGDSTVALADASKKLEVLDREFAFVKEQLVDANREVSRLSAVLGRVNGANPGLIDRLTASVSAAPINARVKSIQKGANGLWYATVDAGTAAGVKTGVVFQVVADGAFLGKITVERVDANESFGRVEGPKVSEALKGKDARTEI